MEDAQVIAKLKCKNCGYEWYPRTPESPKVCPNCKHRNWNQEAKNVKNKSARKTKKSK